MAIDTSSASSKRMIFFNQRYASFGSIDRTRTEHGAALEIRSTDAAAILRRDAIQLRAL
jgi:hypothetical protein